MTLRTTMRPRNPPLRVEVVRPGSVEADMHPSHAVPVVQPADPASLLSQSAGNSMVLGSDGKLYVPVGGVTDRSMVHPQPVAAAEWVVSHGMGKFPAVEIFDSAGDEVEGDVRHIDNNSLRIVFSAPFSGVAYLN